MTDEQNERVARVWREALDAWDDASLFGRSVELLGIFGGIADAD